LRKSILSLLLFCHARVHQEGPDIQPASALILNFSAPTAGRNKFFLLHKLSNLSQVQWCITEISATWEVEIGKNHSSRSSWAICWGDSISVNKPGMMAAPVVPAYQEIAGWKMKFGA
jgi:hypothetical protein